MLRREERRRAGHPEEPDGCFGTILNLLVFDWLFGGLFELGCSGCMTMIGAVLVAAVMLTHGLSHLLHQRLAAGVITSGRLRW